MAFRVSDKDPATMSPDALNKEYDQLDKEATRINDYFIEQGWGRETLRDIEKNHPNDPNTKLEIAIHDRKWKLQIEAANRGADRYPIPTWKRGAFPKRR